MSEWMNNSKLKLNYYSVFFKNTWGLECLFQHLKSPVFFFLFSMNQQYGAKSFSQQISLESIYELSPLAFGLISYREKLWIRCLRVCYYSREFILVRNLISQKYYIFSLPKTCAFVIICSFKCSLFSSWFFLNSTYSPIFAPNSFHKSTTA